MRFLIAGEEAKTYNYANALLHLGVESDTYYYALRQDYDAPILPGGGDIAPSFFHERDYASENVEEEIDYAQFELKTHFIAQGKPILGICKGIQLINVYFGGSVIQNLPTASVHAYQGGDQYHMIYTEEGSFLREIYGRAIITNSAHHQGIGMLGDKIRVAAYTKDNVIEGIWHEMMPIWGVQWHPERMCHKERNVYIADGYRVLEYFIGKVQDMMEGSDGA